MAPPGSVYLFCLFLFGLEYLLKKVILDYEDEDDEKELIEVLNRYEKTIVTRIFPISALIIIFLIILKLPISALLFGIFLPLPHSYDAFLEWKYNREAKRYLVSKYMVIPEVCFSAALIVYYFWYN